MEHTQRMQYSIPDSTKSINALLVRDLVVDLFRSFVMSLLCCLIRSFRQRSRIAEKLSRANYMMTYHAFSEISAVAQIFVDHDSIRVVPPSTLYHWKTVSETTSSP